MIQARGASKRFGAVRALSNIDLEVGAGERVALFGPNGAGKTTLLRVLAGLCRPDAGTITIDGGSPRSARARIGYVGHEPQLYPQLTVGENLVLFARLYRTDTSAVGEMIERAGIGHKRDSHVQTLSRGEIQRASIAKTLLHDPEVLLADEPFTALDEQSLAALPQLLLRDGRTILIATHDKEHAALIVDRLVAMEAGRITEKT